MSYSKIQYLPFNSQHKHLVMGTQFGHLRIASRPFHEPNKPKLVSYKFLCDCGTKCVRTITDIKTNAKLYPPSCGCKTSERRAFNSTVKHPHCKRCGTTDVTDFRRKRKCICYRCRNAIKREESRQLLANPRKRKHHNNAILLSKQRDYISFLKSALHRLCTKQRHSNEPKYKCDLDISYLMKLLDQQHSKCNITGIEMSHQFRCLRSVSIDRVDNLRGHTKDNVQLVCKFVNLGRREHTIEEFYEALNPKELVVYTNDEIRSDLRRLLSAIRSRCCGKRNKRRNLKHNLTLDFMCQLYNSQNGLCAITKTPLNLTPHTLTSCSIDRIDNSKGYLQDNIHLVCVWVNTAKSYHTVAEFKDVLQGLALATYLRNRAQGLDESH